MQDQAHNNTFQELAILLLSAIVFGVAANRLRQPLIIAFILAGILLGPVGLDLIRSTDHIKLLAEMGLSLLLFVVGLKLHPQLIKQMGIVSLATGLGQILFTGTLGFGLSLLMGLSVVQAAYAAAALVFSSTILIVKILSDKRDTESLYGRIALGFLIVEDIVVVLVMVLLSAFTGDSGHSPLVATLLVCAKGAAMAAVVWVASVAVLPRALPTVARSTELLVLFGIGWAMALATFSKVLGFSIEVGAFIAGLSMASTVYRDQLSVKLAVPRDFLLLFFFLELGSHLDLGSFGSQLARAIPLSLLVLIGKPFSVMLILGWMGYRKRTAFMSGLTVAQISEFSLILTGLGVTAGHIGADTLGLVTVVLIITMAVDVHLTMNAQWLYGRVNRYLGFFEKSSTRREDTSLADAGELSENSIILVGLGRYGGKIGRELSQRGRQVIGVDFDPEAVRRFSARGARAIFGDVEDSDFAHHLPLAGARWVISSIRDDALNSQLFGAVREAGFTGYTACVMVDVHDQAPEPWSGDPPDLLFHAYEDAAVQAADLVLAEEDKIAREAMDNKIEQMNDHYIVCGFGRMGKQIVKVLSQYNVQCLVVESNPEQLPILREQQIMHVEGRASEDEVLRRAGITRARGLIAVAATDEENVFIVLTARVLNPKLFIVARSIQQENEDKLKHAGADRVMSPYILGGTRIAAAVVKPEVMDFLDIVVHDHDVETDMAVLRIEAGSPYAGRTLLDLNAWINYGVTVLAVRRDGGPPHPNPRPDHVLAAGDELIVMGTQEQIGTCEAALLEKRSEASSLQ